MGLAVRFSLLFSDVILTLFLIALWACAAPVTLGAGLWWLFRCGITLRRLVPVTAVPLIAYLLVFEGHPISSFGLYWKLSHHRSAYEEVIAAQPPPGWHKASFGRNRVDDRQPFRVAFQFNGLLDNWRGIVYDPTELVEEADGSGPLRYPVKRLFGGDLVECLALEDSFYYCTFT